MIRLEGVGKDYRGQAALDAVDLAVDAGQVFGIIGHSGAGKSTLLRLLNGIERPSRGRVVVDGEDVGALEGNGLRSLRRRVGMIFQHFNLLSSRTVAENVAFPLELAGGHGRAAIGTRVNQLLERVGLAGLASRYPARLSGGQKQRVGIARALACSPKVLLCDEATSALDPQTTEAVLRLLSELNRELGLTIVLITHEMDVVRRICDRVAVLDGGHVVESGRAADVFLHPQHATTQRLVLEAGHIDAATLARDFDHTQGRIVRLTLRGTDTYAPVLAQVARASGVDFNILSGRIDRIRDEPYGQLVLAFGGGDVDRAVRELEGRGAVVEVLR